MFLEEATGFIIKRRNLELLKPMGPWVTTALFQRDIDCLCPLVPGRVIGDLLVRKHL